MEKRTSGFLHVDPETIAIWQKIVDLMAEICGVPAGLIMRITGEDIEVFVRSRTEGNPTTSEIVSISLAPASTAST